MDGLLELAIVGVLLVMAGPLPVLLGTPVPRIVQKTGQTMDKQ
jgi:hypothetical protein